MRRRAPLRILLTAMVVLLVLPTGGTAAFAYWRAAGSGAGAGTTGTNVPVTLTAGTPTTDLYPGGPAEVTLTVSNPNVSPVRIGSLALDTTQGSAGFAVDAGHSGCGLTTLSFSTQNNGGAGWTVNAKVGAVNGTLDIALANGLSMSTGAANACQGAVFTVYLTVGP
jgi:hypothetical protein